jgi:small-conductance mechanosensitive channel
MSWLTGAERWHELTTWLGLQLGVSQATTSKLLNTIALAILYYLTRAALRRGLLPHIDQGSARYRISKSLSWVLAVVIIVGLSRIWLSDLELATYFGIVSAGLAIALKDPLVDMVGFLYILARKPFVLGDRIQLGDQSGDVVDINLFAFTMLEVGNWVHADQSTGRIIHVPNGQIFDRSCANYTQGFDYIWNEIPVTLTFESDHNRAHELLSSIVQSESGDAEQAAREVESIADRYRVSYRYLTPIVWLSVEQFGIVLTMRYLCHARQRRSSADRIWRQVLDAFAQQADIELAYPTQRFYDRAKEKRPPSKTGSGAVVTGDDRPAEDREQEHPAADVGAAQKQLPNAKTDAKDGDQSDKP